MSSENGVVDPLCAFRLDGQVAVVTGASSGIGARSTQTLHAVGATVVAAARRADRLAEVTRGLPRASTACVDLSNPADRERLISSTLAEHGRIDILINNAGMSFGRSVEDELLEEFQAVVELNVTAVWHLAKLAGKSMVRHGSGSIVNVASVFGHVSAAPLSGANYAASKGAVVNLTRELAVQWADRGVRVTALCPGFFPTNLTSDILDDPRAASYVERTAPMRRFGELHELDGALLLLASDAGRYMTGCSVLVDGGWTAR